MKKATYEFRPGKFMTVEWEVSNDKKSRLSFTVEGDLGKARTDRVLMRFHDAVYLELMDSIMKTLPMWTHSPRALARIK